MYCIRRRCKPKPTSIWLTYV